MQAMNFQFFHHLYIANVIYMWLNVQECHMLVSLILYSLSEIFANLKKNGCHLFSRSGNNIIMIDKA